MNKSIEIDTYKMNKYNQSQHYVKGTHQMSSHKRVPIFVVSVSILRYKQAYNGYIYIYVYIIYITIYCMETFPGPKNKFD